MRPIQLPARLQWLRPMDVERMLRVSRSTLVRWERKGVLKAYRSEGGHRRYKLADVEAAIERRDSEF